MLRCAEFYLHILSIYGLDMQKQPLLKAWGESEVNFWRSIQFSQRSYQDDVVSKLAGMRGDFEVMQYGALSINPERYPLYALKSKNWHDDKPTVIVDGGVHGYETSGVKGAVRFMQARAANYTGSFNVLAAPCISPWSYETLNRWNPNALDPNRGFVDGSGVEEAEKFLAFVRENFGEALDNGVLAHFSLHEATNSDMTTFQKLTAMRDGVEFDGGTPIPDGFFVISAVQKQAPDLEKAIVDAVRDVTHIAPTDENGEIYGVKALQPGVIYTNVPGVSPMATNPRYAVTTEVYPDSEQIPLQQREAQTIAAQVAAVTAGMDHLIRDL